MAPQRLITDTGGVFRARQLLAICEALEIEKEYIQSHIAGVRHPKTALLIAHWLVCMLYSSVLGNRGGNTQQQRKVAVPKPSRYVLIWSHQQQHYELHMQGQPEQCFRSGDDEAFSHWLNEHTAFAFWGQAGRLSVLKEARLGGTGYWYAYRTQARHTRKRYLGPSARVTLARLEQEAKALSRSPSAHREATERAAKRRASSLQVEQRGALLSLRLSPPRLPGSL